MYYLIQNFSFAEGISALSADTSAIMLKYPKILNPPSSFTLTTEEADRYGQLAKFTSKIKDDTPCIAESRQISCPKEVPENNHFFLSPQVMIQVESPVQKQHLQFISVISYDHIYDYFWKNNTGMYNPFGSNVLTLSSLISNYKQPLPTDMWEQAQKLADFFKAQNGFSIPASVVLYDLTKSSLSDHPEMWKTTLESAGKHLSTDDKFNLVSLLGQEMGLRYNYDRLNNRGSRASGLVTTTDLLKSVATNTPGGVCRDVALAQAQMLSALGVKQSYVLAYGTQDASHATVIAINPETNKTIHFNYGEMQVGSGISPQNSLVAFTSGYTLFNSEGRPIKQIDSGLGALIKDAMGTKPSYIFGSPDYAINKLSFQTGGGSEFTAATGNTTLGEQVTVFSYTKKGKYLDASIAGFQSQRSDSTYQYDQNGYTGQLKGHYARAIPISNVILTPAIEATGTITSSTNSVSNQNQRPSKMENIEAYGTGKISLNLDLPKKTTVGVSSDAFVTGNNVSSFEKMSLVFDGAQVYAGKEVTISPTQQLALSVTGAVKSYGNAIAFNSTYAQQNMASGATYSLHLAAAQPITDIPEFIPEGNKKASVGLGYENVRTGVQIRVDVNRNISEGQNQMSAKASIPL